ncbi:uncharacterized protein LOC110025430 [Phalaenopsis equestris]|uniref:uncharacterized protein LOC110025430 n=1 Tax=Phalaenopsis equestris TaxID=78828 RepID=UPI0009E1E356|nr:uncharacterized protein LOC110025430 [Phalaenopsis equestris]
MLMSPEDLQESDVLWPEPRRSSIFPSSPLPITTTTANRPMKLSAPIRIPQPSFRFAGGDEYMDSDGMIPPHEMTARRWARERMACSVCTGEGRTLKGRDLRQVRNAVLKLTGFLEG